eukprot:TRINITY_DN6417_c0_g1_i1.p1 TRINITY_DN6417_c0_g1~~TRINITY_DN6417_c0_g1_i1.p1  ORF type:complete len:172 (-),score=29.54 TRINITY_DN6417_c0_g1_i1:224-739(-)
MGGCASAPAHRYILEEQEEDGEVDRVNLISKYYHSLIGPLIAKDLVIPRKELTAPEVAWAGDYFYFGLADLPNSTEWEKQQFCRLSNLFKDYVHQQCRLEYRLEDITLVGNPFLLKKFLRKCRDDAQGDPDHNSHSPLQLAFHGTAETNIGGIMKKGFLTKGELDDGWCND